MQMFDSRTVDPAVFAQEFNPQLRFIRFLQGPVDLGTELSIGSSS